MYTEQCKGKYTLKYHLISDENYLNDRKMSWLNLLITFATKQIHLHDEHNKNHI